MPDIREIASLLRGVLMRAAGDKGKFHLWSQYTGNIVCEHPNGGLCYGLSLLYLQHRAKGQDFPEMNSLEQFVEGKFQSEFQKELNEAHYSQAKTTEARAALLEKLGLKVVGSEDFKEDHEKCGKFLKKDNFYYLIHTDGGGKGHTMAAETTKGDPASFFDPNVGVVTSSRNKMANIVQKYLGDVELQKYLGYRNPHSRKPGPRSKIQVSVDQLKAI